MRPVSNACCRCRLRQGLITRNRLQILVRKASSLSPSRPAETRPPPSRTGPGPGPGPGGLEPDPLPPPLSAPVAGSHAALLATTQRIVSGQNVGVHFRHGQTTQAQDLGSTLERAQAVSPLPALNMLDLYKDVNTLSAMLEEESTEHAVAKAFNFFESSLYPHISRLDMDLPHVLKQEVMPCLLRAMTVKKLVDFQKTSSGGPADPLLPTVARLTELFTETLSQPPAMELWTSLMYGLMAHICRMSTRPADYPSDESYLAAEARREALMLDVVAAWKALKVSPFTALRVGNTALAAQRQEFSAHRNPDVEVGGGGGGGGRSSLFQTLVRVFARNFPHYSETSMEKPTLVAFASFVVLSDPALWTRAVREQAASFVEMMSSLLENHASQLAAYEKALLKEGGPDLAAYVRSRRTALEAALSRNVPGRSGLSETAMQGRVPAQASRPRLQDEVPAEAVHRRLGWALQGASLGAVKQVWQDFWGEAPAPDPARIEYLAENVTLLDFFVYAYMSVQRPDLAIGVWNSMVRIGIKPTIRTWTSMMAGCARAKNARGIANIWDRLVKSGEQLDTTAWTARISGLADSGDPDAAIAALVEMAATWRKFEASKKNAKTSNKIGKGVKGGTAAAAVAARVDASEVLSRIAVEPSIEPVNAALGALVRLGRTADAKQVLSWASKLDAKIAPDVVTFNTLLQPLVRSGQSAEVEALFQTMASFGVRADPHTFTIIMDAALRNIGRAPFDQQHKVVAGILAEMTAAGVPVNMQLYAKMINLLLEQRPPADSGSSRRNSRHRDGDNNKAGNRGQQQQQQRDADPVTALMSYIRSLKLEPSSPIYTSLVEHYFSSSPPQVDQVQSLINTWNLFERPWIDRVFWERVASGYCQAGEIGLAMDVFDRVFMPKEGEVQKTGTGKGKGTGVSVEGKSSNSGLDSGPNADVNGGGGGGSSNPHRTSSSGGSFVNPSTLHELLQDLLRRGLMKQAARLVAFAVAQGLAEHPGGTAAAAAAAARSEAGDKIMRRWRHRLWHLADHHGLLGEEARGMFLAATNSSKIERRTSRHLGR